MGGLPGLFGGTRNRVRQSIQCKQQCKTAVDLHKVSKLKCVLLKVGDSTFHLCI